jgi:hypothetical protein
MACKTKRFAACQNFPTRNISIADRSCWLILWQPKKTFAERRVESVMAEVERDPKDGMMVLETISAGGDILVLCLVAAGTTSG